MGISAKKVILTAIHFKGVEQVKKESEKLADDCLCSVSYVMSIIRQFEKGSIIVKNR